MMFENTPGLRRHLASAKRGDLLNAARFRLRQLRPHRDGTIWVTHSHRSLLADLAGPHDVHEVRSKNLLFAETTLRSAGIPYSTVFDAVPSNHVLVTRAEDHARAISELRRALPDDTWHITRSGDLRADVFRACADPRGFIISGPEQAVRIEGWNAATTMRRPDDGYYQKGTLVAPNPDGYSVPFISEIGAEASSSPHVSQFCHPVDAVYTWVDGTDPDWKSRRDRALSAQSASDGHAGATDPARFVSFDELKYSLRSLLTYANWIRKIFIVTDAQVPPWLDVDHPRIHIVDHRDILPGPVFNSHAIESRLHRIEGLAEHYIYLNDDVFFGNEVHPEQFFPSDRIHHYFPNTLPLDQGASAPEDPPNMAAGKNGRDLLEQRFGKRVHYKILHTAHPQQKTLAMAAEDEFPEAFDRVSRSLFRSPEDISVASSLIHWYGQLTGRALPGSIRAYYGNLINWHTTQELDALYSLRRYDTFCLNFERSGPDWQDRATQMQQFLERYFPFPAPWEST